MRRHPWVLLAASLLAGLLLPIGAYVTGGRLIGPYEGTRGLASYLGAIFGDASRGHPLALSVILAPVLCLALWLLRRWLVKRVFQPRRSD
jgi:hypothetical protein